MIVVLAFAVTLVLAALISGPARRTPLSTAALFLVAGFLIGPGALNIVRLPSSDRLLSTFAELALVSVLFVDGMRLDARDLLSAARLPGRALLFGLPLTLLVVAVFGHFVAGLAWHEGLLLGAVLAPTDPVFASALVQRSDIPTRLRRLLGIESGLNDGLALPIVLAILALMGSTQLRVMDWVGEVVLGVLLGIGLAWGAVLLCRLRFVSVAGEYRALMVLAVGLLVYALSALAHLNSFLATYAAGITLATVGPDFCDAFRPHGEFLAEALKLAALLIFGALLSLDFLRETKPNEFLFALLVLVLARPLGLGLALLGSALPWRERLVAEWFGPRGFASVLYGLYVLGSGVPRAGYLFRLAAVVIVASILVHSSTDVAAAQWLERHAGRQDREKQPVRRHPKGEQSK